MKGLPEVMLLCGFSGSGKTKTGEILADKIGYKFVDTDKVIEDHFGKTIPEIFLQMGEGKFRFAEADVIRLAVKQKPMVIALGGGALGDEHAVAYLKSCGRLVYLQVTPETVYDRLQDSDLRPMLKTFSKGEADQRAAVMERIESLLKTREPLYSQADEIVDTEGKSPEAVADEIRERLDRDD